MIKRPFKNGIPILPIIILLLLLTWATILYAKGYRVDLAQKEVKVTQTGMLYVRSNPEGAKVYLNGKAVTATNSTISSLAPSKYTVRVTKEGFDPWEKEVEVFNELVTDITALLISKSPRLEPITNYGVSTFAMSHDGTKIAYTTKNSKNPGVWLLPLSGGSNISIFGGNRNLLVEDTPTIAYSLGKEIYWSPDDKELLAKLGDDKYYLVSASGGSFPNNILVEATSSAQPTFSFWEIGRGEKLKKYVEDLKLDEPTAVLALDSNTLWSPDYKKFLTSQKVDDNVIYKVYNFEEPLPVGEKREYTSIVANKDTDLYVSWYTDSFHLVMVEDSSTVYIVRIDGTNKTEIFTGNLASNKAYATPAGDKIIILASFKQNVPSDLYTVSIR